MKTDTLKDNINRVATLRQHALQRLFHLQDIPDANTSFAIKQIPHLCMLMSSSRGGSSVTAELLQWQGADCQIASKCLLTLPGEEKPHLALAGLACPVRDELYDDLTEADAQSGQVQFLLEEFRSEIGTPLAYCVDLELYATQLYRRLLLQWPMLLTQIPADEALASLKHELEDTFPDGYRDGSENRRLALGACVRCFAFIKPDFYDCWQWHNDSAVITMAQQPWSFEETPFIFPPPWRNARTEDLAVGTLLLRDPSNAWRMPFWRKVFEHQNISMLHLVRDPRESVQGLCDGWNYPFGFQTITTPVDIDIKGYIDGQDPEHASWKKRRLNFSICRSLSEKIFIDKESLTLVELCAYQWKDAHRQIIEDSIQFKMDRTVINFADLRHNTEVTFRKICERSNLEFSKSAASYIEAFPNHWVMTTPQAKKQRHDRWLTSPYADEIMTHYDGRYFDSITDTLGLFGSSTLKTARHA